MKLPDDRPIIIETDWTLSTRGENAASMEGLLRVVMRRNIKFIIFSGADVQAPQVARDIIRDINAERVKNGERPYKRWDDYVDIGYIPDIGGMANAMSTNLKGVWGTYRSKNAAGIEEPIFNSPVLKNVERVEDISLLVNITASGTIDTLVQRLSPGKTLTPGQKVKGKLPLACMCTGVMGPQALPYKQANQVVGLCIGLKGAYDFEYMMENGVPTAGGGGEAIPGWKGKTNLARAQKAYLALHVSLALLILGVVVGNVGYAFSKPRRRAN